MTNSHPINPIVMKNQMHSTVMPRRLSVVRLPERDPAHPFKLISKTLCFVNRFHGASFFKVHQLANDQTRWDDNWFNNYE